MELSCFLTEVAKAYTAKTATLPRRRYICSLYQAFAESRVSARNTLSANHIAIAATRPNGRAATSHSTAKSVATITPDNSGSGKLTKPLTRQIHTSAAIHWLRSCNLNIENRRKSARGTFTE